MPAAGFIKGARGAILVYNGKRGFGKPEFVCLPQRGLQQGFSDTLMACGSRHIKVLDFGLGAKRRLAGGAKADQPCQRAAALGNQHMLGRVGQVPLPCGQAARGIKELCRGCGCECSVGITPRLYMQACQGAGLIGARSAQGYLPKHQRITAFWAWRRFSASSQMTDCGPSITLLVTSSPRWAGRQCMNRASGLAWAIRASSTW